MRYVAGLFIVNMWLIHNSTCSFKKWAQVHYKKVSINNAMEKDKLLKFSKKDISPFTQLIFSWNSFRPEVGYFSFWAQVRNKKTKQWSKWHKMVDWGEKIQRSYFQPDTDFSLYAHVRLEIMKKQLADAFAIMVTVHDGASLSSLHSLAVSLSNFNDFRSEVYNKNIKKLESVFISGIPRIAQFSIKHDHKHRICSPVSCTMLTRFLSGYPIDPLDFAYNAFDDGLDAYGSWPFNMAHAFEQCGGNLNFFVTRLNSFTELYQQLRRGIPVVVSVRGHLEGAPKNYPHGHLMLVIGWDNKRKNVLCYDPAFDNEQKIKKSYSLESFIRSWERSHRLTYWVEPIRNSD